MASSTVYKCILLFCYLFIVHVQYISCDGKKSDSETQDIAPEDDLSKFLDVQYVMSSQTHLEQMLIAYGFTSVRVKLAMLVRPTVYLTVEGDQYVLVVKILTKTLKRNFVFSQPSDDDTPHHKHVTATLTKDNLVLTHVKVDHRGKRPDVKLVATFGTDKLLVTIEVRGVTAELVFQPKKPKKNKKH